MTDLNRFEKAAVLARGLKKLDEKHDKKCRVIEDRAANQKLEVAWWLAAEREKLLAAADPEARALVLGEEQPTADPDPLPAIGGVECDRATGKTRRV